jgi:hypothetical protein
MRHVGKILAWVGAAAVGMIGCHAQPNLKPPEAPEVLNAPDPNDKRYSQPAEYPATELANDPVKKELGLPATPLDKTRGPKPGSMGMGGGGP